MSNKSDMDKDTPEYKLWWQRADGSGGGSQRLSRRDYANNPRSIFPDGRLLAFNEQTPETQADLWILRVSDGIAGPFHTTPFAEAAPTFGEDSSPKQINVVLDWFEELKRRVPSAP